MKITDVTLTMIDWDDAARVRYGAHNPITDSSQIGLLQVFTDEGVVGESFLGASYRSAEIDCWSLIKLLKPVIMGKNPLARGALNAALMSRIRSTTYRAIGCIDVALWDIAGKVAGLPIHEVIGTCKTGVPAYASSATMHDHEAYIDEALAVKEAGYVGYKTHPPLDTDLDGIIRLHQRIREAVGPEFGLMLDASGHMDYPRALILGEALKELRFLWFEDPLPAEDIWTYVKLCQKLDIMVMATEYAPGGHRSYAPWITLHATDALRGDVAVKGGITPCLMTAHMAAGFNMNYEIHHGGNSIANIANLHLAMAIPNCTMFEVLLPNEAQQYGVLDDLKVAKDGTMPCPAGPGLGVEIDRDLVKRKTVAVLT